MKWIVHDLKLKEMKWIAHDLKLNEMKWIVHDFWLSFIINNEQIESNLNGVFANKYNKIWHWPRNFDNFWEFLNLTFKNIHL